MREVCTHRATRDVPGSSYPLRVQFEELEALSEAGYDVPDPASPEAQDLSNDVIAAAFDRVADLLEAGHANPYRVRAYRGGAATLRGLDRPASEILEDEGLDGLVDLPNIGKRLAAAVAEMLQRGTFSLLRRLEGRTDPQALIASVPGVGPILAGRVYEQLGVETLEELEAAAHDGRLDSVSGFGPRRCEALRHTLADMLRRSSALRRAAYRRPPSEAPAPTTPRERPDVTMLLDVDAEYRRRAQAGELRTIAPRRFNPEGKSWLPLLHTTRGNWEFDAMFSNTALAHELGRTDDWVVIYWHHDHHEGQCTVVTERSGADRGLRVVRGRELECRRARH
jgi:hypothetical protein